MMLHAGVLHENYVGVKHCSSFAFACSKVKFVSYIYILLSFLSACPAVEIDKLF